MSGKCHDILHRPDIPEPIASKDKTKVCKCCHHRFTQVWDGKLGKYSSFDLCPKCRLEKQNEKVSTYVVNYTPFEYQKKMHDSLARFRVVAGGIRTGKDYSMTFEFAKYLIDCGNENRPEEMIPKVRGWIVAPTDDIAKEDFVQLRRIIPAAIVSSYSKSTNVIELINGVQIEVKSAYDPESLVGVGLDAVLITEAARIKALEDVWSNLEGRLTSPGRGKNGMGGIALINSSPLGKNYFYKMWLWGNPASGDYDSDWESFTWSHWDNPLMKEKENRVDRKTGLTYRQRLERRMSKARYEQDYLAKFITNTYAVFPQFEKCLEKVPDMLDGKPRENYIARWRSPKEYCSYSIGYDPASLNDSPVVWVKEEETGRIVFMADMLGKGWDAQMDYIAMLSVRYNSAPVKFGRTGHEMIDSQLTKRGVDTVPINEQGSNKENLVENLARVVENRQITILDDGSEITERAKLEFTDYVRDKAGGKVVFRNATSGGHDDHVSAAYFVCSDMESEKQSIPYDGLLTGV